MAKLYFYHGTMGSSKTANALITCHNYEKLGKKVVLCKPKIDIRDGKNKIKSRIGLERDCITLEEFLEGVYNQYKYQDTQVVIVDEVQFAKEKQINSLANLVDYKGIDVLCFGLRTDFQTHLFEGSKRLFEIADCLREIKTVCWCSNKAILNARYNNGGLITEGQQIELGSDDKYISLCRKHYKQRKLS